MFVLVTDVYLPVYISCVPIPVFAADSQKKTGQGDSRQERKSTIYMMM